MRDLELVIAVIHKYGGHERWCARAVVPERTSVSASENVDPRGEDGCRWLDSIRINRPPRHCGKMPPDGHEPWCMDLRFGWRMTAVPHPKSLDMHTISYRGPIPNDLPPPMPG